MSSFPTFLLSAFVAGWCASFACFSAREGQKAMFWVLAAINLACAIITYLGKR